MSVYCGGCSCVVSPAPNIHILDFSESTFWPSQVPLSGSNTHEHVLQIFAILFIFPSIDFCFILRNFGILAWVLFVLPFVVFALDTLDSWHRDNGKNRITWAMDIQRIHDMLGETRYPTKMPRLFFIRKCSKLFAPFHAIQVVSLSGFIYLTAQAINCIPQIGDEGWGMAGVHAAKYHKSTV